MTAFGHGHGQEVAVAFPDEGAKKRFGGFFEKEGYPVHSLRSSAVVGWGDRVTRIGFWLALNQNGRQSNVADMKPHTNHGLMDQAVGFPPHRQVPSLS